LPESEGMGTRILFVLGVLAQAGCAATPLRFDEVERLERARFEAMTRQDVAALEPMLADDLVYCHSDGSCESKREFLETIRSGRIRYIALEVLELRPRAYGDVILFNGVVAVEGVLGGQTRTFNVVFTDAYARRGDDWQLVAWQSTRKP
jgi:ketosteroid isomerase-like protein